VIACDVATSDRDTGVAAYEDLRKRVVTGADFGSHLGLVQMLREGLTAWMSRCSTRFVTPEAAAIPARRAASITVSDEIHASLVQVLAGMALCSREESST